MAPLAKCANSPWRTVETSARDCRLDCANEVRQVELDRGPIKVPQKAARGVMSRSATAVDRIASPVFLPSSSTLIGFAIIPLRCRYRINCSAEGPCTPVPPMTVRIVMRSAF